MSASNARQSTFAWLLNVELQGLLPGSPSPSSLAHAPLAVPFPVKFPSLRPARSYIQVNQQIGTSNLCAPVFSIDFLKGDRPLVRNLNRGRLRARPSPHHHSLIFFSHTHPLSHTLTRTPESSSTNLKTPPAILVPKYNSPTVPYRMSVSCQCFTIIAGQLTQCVDPSLKSARESVMKSLLLKTE